MTETVGQTNSVRVTQRNTENIIGSYFPAPTTYNYRYMLSLATYIALKLYKTSKTWHPDVSGVGWLEDSGPNTAWLDFIKDYLSGIVIIIMELPQTEY